MRKDLQRKIKALLSGSVVCTLIVLSCSIAWAEKGHLRVGQAGPELCFPSPYRSAPNLSGPPQWPAENGNAGGQLRGDVSDPRWGTAPLTNFIFDNNTGTARYRALVNGDFNELSISIQVLDDANGPNKSDSVYLGIYNPTASNAWGIQIPAYKGKDLSDNIIKGKFLSPDITSVKTYKYENGDWTEVGITPTAFPDWITNVGLWNDRGNEGNENEELGDAVWAVQFKIRLDRLGFLPDDAARISMGANVSTGGALSPAVPYALPNSVDGCDNVCLGGEFCDATTPCQWNDECVANACPPCDGRCAFVGPFLAYPDEWSPTAEFNDGCVGGLEIHRDGIGTTHDDGQSLLKFGGSLDNVFFAKPVKPEGFVLGSEQIKATFRMSNWGSVADPQTGWRDIPNGTDVLNSDSTGEIGFSCQNSQTPGDVCGMGLNLSMHQCMHVEISQVGDNHVQITKGTDFRNMYFVEASSRDEMAEISIEGLEAMVGNPDGRDVYLHVKTTNMPVVGQVPMEEDVPAQRALWAQVSPFYDLEYPLCYWTERCLISEETDIDDDGYGSFIEVPEALCHREDVNATECWNDTQDPSCLDFPHCFENGGGKLVDGKVWCVNRYYPQRCSGLPAGGGVNSEVSAKTGAQLTNTEIPTYEVYPYYDSGETMVLDGQIVPRLVPMYPFGIHIIHEGTYFGFLHSLVNENDSEIVDCENMTGPGLCKIEPGFFKMTIPHDGTARVRVLVSAEEEPHYQPFTEVTGSATMYSWWYDTVNITGVLATDSPLDLGGATVSLEKLLEEDGTELVSDLNGPIELTALPGGTSSLAVYTHSGDVDAVLEVMKLPLIGYATVLAVKNADVDRPSNCGWWFGSTDLVTAFEIDDQANPIVGAQGEDQWTCTPFGLWNMFI